METGKISSGPRAPTSRGRPVFQTQAFAAWVKGQVSPAAPETFQGVTQDTRKLLPGDLYVALKGDRFDGHGFVRQAIRDGAAAALVDAAWTPDEAIGNLPLIRVADTRRALQEGARAWRMLHRATILGITGSSGKTTTKEMAAALLSGGGRVCATEGNLNNDIGLPLSLLAMPAETDFGVFEAGMNHPGEIAGLADVLRPHGAIISSIGSAHIEYFGSVEAIAREKSELLRVLPATGFAVLSRDTEFHDLLAACSPAPVVTVSLRSKEAAFFGERLDVARGTIRVTERATGEITHLESGLPGEHNASNLLLAFAAARRAGVSAQQAVAGMARFSMPGKRWERQDVRGATIINDAYNANPDSMRAAIATFLALPCTGRRILVLGDMRELGDHAERAHRELGRYVATLESDLLLAVGENSQRFMAEEAMRCGARSRQVVSVLTVEEAIHVLREVIRPDDRILLKASRGMALERILDGLSV